MREKNDSKKTFSEYELTKLCRSCLCEVHRDYFSLGGFYLERKVLDIYKNVTSVEINTNDESPKKLCVTCYDHIIKFDLFKNKVLESEKLLSENCLFRVEKGVINERSDVKETIDNSEIIENDFDFANDENGDVQTSDSDDELPILDRLKKEDKCTVKKYDKENENSPKGYSNLREIKETEWEENCDVTVSQEIEEVPKVKRKKQIKRRKLLTDDGLSQKKKPERRKEPCAECGKLLFAYKMENHMRIHTKEKPYGCEVCGTCFSEKSNLNRHLKIHGNIRPYKCEKCGKGFLRPSSRAIHIVTAHNSERNVLCPLCGKGFKHQYFLNKHMSNIHNKSDQKVKVNGPGYPCSICGNFYRTKSSLTVHKMKHEQPKAFLCNICGNGYSTKAVLENHQRVHTGEKNFSCDICNKKFRFITTLKTHTLVHSGEKPLSCHICKKQFRQHSHLNTHIKGQHSTDRPYQCSFCLKTFKQSCNLTVHTRIHTGETPYHCDVCQKGFYDSSSMKKHKKSHFEKNSLEGSWVKMEMDDKPVGDSISLQA